jgi:hypothetical protein
VSDANVRATGLLLLTRADIDARLAKDPNDAQVINIIVEARRRAAVGKTTRQAALDEILAERNRVAEGVRNPVGTPSQIGVNLATLGALWAAGWWFFGGWVSSSIVAAAAVFVGFRYLISRVGIAGYAATLLSAVGSIGSVVAVVLTLHVHAYLHGTAEPTKAQMGAAVRQIAQPVEADGTKLRPGKDLAKVFLPEDAYQRYAHPTPDARISPQEFAALPFDTLMRRRDDATAAAWGTERVAYYGASELRRVAAGEISRPGRELIAIREFLLLAYPSDRAEIVSLYENAASAAARRERKAEPSAQPGKDSAAGARLSAAGEVVLLKDLGRTKLYRVTTPTGTRHVMAPSEAAARESINRP